MSTDRSDASDQASAAANPHDGELPAGDGDLSTAEAEKAALIGHTQDVTAALQATIAHLETVARDVDRRAQRLIADGRYPEARTLVGLAERLVDFKSSIIESTRKWVALGAALDGSRPTALLEEPAYLRSDLSRSGDARREGLGSIEPSETAPGGGPVVPNPVTAVWDAIRQRRH